MPPRETDAIAEMAKDHAASAAAGLQGLPGDVSVASFLADYAAVGDLDHYRHVPEPARATLGKVATATGAEGQRRFLRVALGEGIAALIASGRLDALPPRIVGHHLQHLKRIAAAIGSDAEAFDVDSDLFLKDMGLVTLRLYAAAAQLLDTRCGIPRSVVARGGVASAPENLLKFARLGGFKPYVQIHTHLSNLGDFNEEGWNECYRCCADLYEVRPDLLGMFGSSWFYDPALATISPRLSYLRDIPVQGGAELFFYEAGGHAIHDALSTSSSRRKLYEEKKYLPTSYMLVWGRKQQTAWARRA